MKKVVIYWENFGPYHVDRCEALARKIGKSGQVIGLELADATLTYGWENSSTAGFLRQTLIHNLPAERVTELCRFWVVVRACIGHLGSSFFFCHYEKPAILATAFILRMMGQRVFVMNDSKFDDYDRKLWREVVKRIFYLPYNGALSAGGRNRGYLRFMGFPDSRIEDGYDSISLDRIRATAATEVAPGGTAFENRHFTIVARLIPKKNIPLALRAYALYRAQTKNPRMLEIVGSGPEYANLMALTEQLGIVKDVSFRGWQQSDVVAKSLAHTLAVILPSTEEQYGLAIVEALAMGLPVIVSDNCGVRDHLVRNACNGFVVEPDNYEGLAWFMCRLSEDRVLWESMSRISTVKAEQGDVSHFADGVLKLMDAPR